MGNALYRKYRSNTLEEIIGQDHITSTLSNALKTGKIGHAYLFTGPRGVGKTSIARIFAREVNGLPVDTKEHLDIIEIDAASNRRIDEVRDLREKALIAPANAKYKVYIVDEVHMLTKEAFNALLKTLEEPPEHVIFILATTELHKLPETIISRTQRYSFKPIRNDAAAKQLRKIAKKEEITITDDALELVAQHGQGSFRDSLSLLDQIRHTHKSNATEIDAEDVRLLLGLPPEDIVQSVVQATSTGDVKAVISACDTLREQGVDAAKFALTLSEQVRQRMLASKQPQQADLALLRELIEVPGSTQPHALLELALLGSIRTENNSQSKQEVNTPPNTQPATPEPKVTQSVIKQTKATNIPKDKTATYTKPTENKSANVKKSFVTPNKDIEAIWQQILEELKGTHNTLYGMARMARPQLKDDEWILECKYNFHAKRLSDTQHKAILVKKLQNHLDREVALTCVVPEKQTVQKAEEPRPEVAKEPSAIETVSNIFGNAEVIES
jgi:DNA polymerase III subunit gamma/tau